MCEAALVTGLLLHGLGATGRVWDGWVALGGEWLAPDLAGHGGAEGLREYTFGSMAAAVAEGLAVRRGLTIVGHSLGGVIAITGFGGKAIGGSSRSTRRPSRSGRRIWRRCSRPARRP